ncbi:IS1182 family transposase [Acidaminobacter sp. JC074]|uniref:IS1182 family transposase n=1 Tax=Acidaminobacter sp. JC074 TaxID=2530199 RepID=UPI001F0EE4C0|nr:IS1182 family transposase [Acidaminobacter sp. JC074]
MGYGQIEFNFKLLELKLPDSDPVYTLLEVLKKLDFKKLFDNYSRLGRSGYNPVMLYAVVLYANMRGIRAIDRIVELCTRDLGFITITDGETPSRTTFYNFLNDKLTTNVLDDLHYQFIRLLKDENLVSLKALYIDGTKIEANSNRYTFVWRGSVNYHLAGLLDKIGQVYDEYNSIIKSNRFDKKYILPCKQMFVIEGMDRVKEIIEKNRERKRNNKNKVSNNVILEIDNCSPIDMLELQRAIKVICDGEGIYFVRGKEQKKPRLQHLYEELELLGGQLLKYKKYFEIMGDDRNSFSKTDLEATFMRLKSDYMRNGQLKPCYNVQVAVENYFVIHVYVSNDRTDYNTLIPVAEKHKKHFIIDLRELTADSGYCSERNLSYLHDEKVTSYIKLQTHEKMKKKSYKEDIGKYYNMKKVVKTDETYYICHAGKKLSYMRTESSTTKGFTQNFQVYGCHDCTGCQHKEKCLYQYDPERDQEKNKVMKVNENWEQLRMESHKNILSEKGILNRQIRSIQTEGYFGDIKANDGFTSFNHRSEEKVYKEFLLNAVGKNMMKYHRFINGNIKEFKGKSDTKAA